jgi:hypothetical protein
MTAPINTDLNLEAIGTALFTIWALIATIRADRRHTRTNSR